jgi:hypothetical protein
LVHSYYNNDQVTGIRRAITDLKEERI